jgi:hypothetical protein
LSVLGIIAAMLVDDEQALTAAGSEFAAAGEAPQLDYAQDAAG